jgi:cytoskeletal protein RodZ
MRSTLKPKEQTLADNQKELIEEDETFLPPRHVVHPAEREKWLRFFYLSLLWVFILLVAGLLFWGWQRVQSEA